MIDQPFQIDCQRWICSQEGGKPEIFIRHVLLTVSNLTFEIQLLQK